MNRVEQIFSLEGEVALVTGASRGIGAEIATLLGQAGATIVGTATQQSGADSITERFKADGLTGRGLVVDVSDKDSIAALIKDVQGQEGNISILINNAGITRDNLLMRMKDDEWDSIIETNLSSVFHLSKAVLRGMMKARKGRIISVSSVVGVMGNMGQSNYAAAKAGLAGFSKSLAREVGSRGITVNLVAPGFVETSMTDSLDDDRKATLIEEIPLRRLGNVNDIAAAVLFLAASSGAYISGETIHVNGGMYMI